MGYVSTIDIFVTSLNINFLFHPPTDFKKQPVPYYKGTPVFPMDEFSEHFHTASDTHTHPPSGLVSENMVALFF